MSLHWEISACASGILVRVSVMSKLCKLCATHVTLSWPSSRDNLIILAAPSVVLKSNTCLSLGRNSSSNSLTNTVRLSDV